MTKNGTSCVKMMNACARSTVLLVDDHALVREGFSALIRDEPDLELTAAVGGVAEAEKQLAARQPDILVLDLSLPGVSGIDWLKDLRVRYPQLPVLVVSMHEESVYAERVLRSGARGYVMKQQPAAKVLEAIRSVLRGELFVSAELAARMLKTFVGVKSGVENGSEIDMLSDRELQVYACIGHGVNTRNIASKLNLSPKTVQTYREHIKRKLGLSNATELVYRATHWVQCEGA